MADAIEVVCNRPYDLPSSDFIHSSDQFRNALYLPQLAFAVLDIEHYSYVRMLGSADHTPADCPRVLTAPLCEQIGLQAPNADPPRCRGALRTNIYESLSDTEQHAEKRFHVVPDETVSKEFGETYRTHDDSIADRVCHLSSNVMKSLSVTAGQKVELFNPETGGRTDIKLGEPHEDHDGVFRVDVRTRQALDLEIGNRIGVRTLDFDTGSRRGIKYGLLKRLIDSREMPFNVQLGPDQDEYRNIVRITEDMMRFLGIETGDNVVLRWRGKETKSQCLPIRGSTDPPNTVKMPATERDRIDISVNDAVLVERDMGYVLREQVAVSVIGIIGGVLGVLQVVPLIGTERMTAVLGPAGSGVAIIFAVTLLSALIIWLLLIPERQKCVTHE